VTVTATGTRRRIHGRVEGTVQGVGFRPYVHRLARELGLAGTVGNDERGVLLEVEGDPDAVAAFLARLPDEAPALALVERVLVHDVPATGERAFAIVASERHGAPAALVVPDAATCDECLAELTDPADRRHRYPFINCTNCGPRFTIVRDVPYDRPRTTMAAFAMCDACRAEYEDPGDRRFHAQPNACPVCGPRARLVDAEGSSIGGGDEDAVAAAARLLAAGAIVAIKGLGGYHLACRADDEDVVRALRARKHREDRPFALMAGDVPAARALVELGSAEEALLRSAARPIVLAPRRAGALVADAVAPASRELGVMLPYAPLHHLLLGDAGGTLVMTSGNVSDEPIAYRDEDALARLAKIADAFLIHDRPIHTRTDDSVVRVAAERTVMLRRSRGYVPGPVALPVAAPRPVLACGAELKSTFCVAKGARAWVGHHIGDLRNAETLGAYREGIAHFERLFAVTPEVVARDLHPDYLATSYALEREGVELLAVQHHHAHLAACLAEHGESQTTVGAIYDGAGYGADGTVWGGEVLVGDLRGYTRVAALWPVRLPGGDRAAREPWRMACSWLVAATGAEPALPAPLAGRVDQEAWHAIARMAASGFAAPVTTSMGRLFDAVAALCGLRTQTTYEGQAAIELEAVADHAERGSYELGVGADGRLDARPTILAVLADQRAGTPAAVISARFHRAVAAATADACAAAAADNGIDRVALSGGVFQNRLLLEETTRRLSARGLRVLLPERLPPNDGAISYGQAAIAAAVG
jgi:hydrogenase maturation protein HypF